MIYAYKGNLLLLSNIKRMSKAANSRGMKVGAVSLWLLLVLSERPMYGYEIKRELEKRFAGYWKPKTGTIYPALEKLEETGLVTSEVEFRDGAPDRKHYALTEKGQSELAQSMAYWTKMTEVLETYWEAHQAIFRHKSEINRENLSKLFVEMAKSLKNKSPIEIAKILSLGNKKVLVKSPSDPIELKFLYAKEKTKENDDKFEIHMEIEWKAKDGARTTKK
jgi:PadR family transcriptional regulator, regulatory protein PadR